MVTAMERSPMGKMAQSPVRRMTPEARIGEAAETACWRKKMVLYAAPLLVGGVRPATMVD